MHCVRLFFALMFLSSLCSSQTNEAAGIDALLGKSKSMLNDKPDSALKLAMKAAELSEKQRSDLLSARSYDALAQAFFETSDVDKSILYEEKAVEAANRSGDRKLIIRSLVNLGIAYSEKGMVDRASLNLRKALNVLGKGHDEMEFTLYKELGISYSKGAFTHNTDSALKFLDLALKAAYQQNDSSKIADGYRTLSLFYSDKDNYREALEYLGKALTISIKINNSKLIATIYKDMGDIHYFKKEYDLAFDLYKKAYEINKKINDITGMAYNSVDLAYMYALQKRRDLTDQYADEAYNLARHTNSWLAIHYCGRWLSEAYEIAGDYKKAVFYHKVLESINDSINNRDRIEKISRMEAQNNFESKIHAMREDEEKNKLVAAEKEKRDNLVRNILVVAFGVTLVLLFFTYRNYVEKKKANVLVNRQKEEAELQKQKIEEINKEITDSINYAKVIQRSILPKENDIQKTFPQSFGLYKPRSVVSGDFYWSGKLDDICMMAAADCTGHGVPGAFMSMIGIDKLNLAVHTNNITDPGRILSFLNAGVKTSLQQKDGAGGSQDGMDIALCCFDFTGNKLKFAGANRPLLLVRGGVLTEFKGAKASIGGITPQGFVFASSEIEIRKGDTFYMFTDGYADQFGGKTGKKMMTKNFKQLLLSIQNIPFVQQEKYLEEKLNEWQGNFEQVDDILVIGIRV